MNYMRALAIVLIVLGIGCKSSETSNEKKISMEEEVTEIKLEALTRGYREEITITPNQMEFFSTQEKMSQKLNSEQWENIVKKLSAVDIKNISSYKAPTEKRFHDGDLATTLTIVTQSNTYQSTGFDKQNPPKELKEIVDAIYSLKK